MRKKTNYNKIMNNAANNTIYKLFHKLINSNMFYNVGRLATVFYTRNSSIA